jgi:hypothetical protein
MKNYILALVLVYSFGGAIAQDRPADLPSQSHLFRNFHGLVSSSGEYFLEGQGYSISLTPLSRTATKRAIDSIGATKTKTPKGFLARLAAKQSGIVQRTEIRSFIDSGLPLPNQVVASSLYHTDKLVQAERFYIVRTREDEILDVMVLKANSIDSVFVRQLLLSIYYDGIPKSIVTPYQAISFEFVGRKIELYPPGFWSEGHNLAAGGDQLNWSIHDNYEDAATETLFQLKLNRLRFEDRVQSQDTIDVVFEGTSTRATRVVYRLPWYGYTPGESRELIVYYIAAEVRGKYVHCVLSHYNHETTEKALAAKVIPKLMRLKTDSSGTALYKTVQPAPIEQDYWNAPESYFHYQWFVGVWHPLGNLVKTIGTSPAFGGTGALRFAKQWKLDCNINFFVPVRVNRFAYKLPDTLLFAKPDALSIAMGFGVTHANRLGGKWFFDQALGVGTSFINTDQKKPKLNHDETQSYYDLTSIDFSLGLNVRKYIKRGNYFGLNATWHYTPFSSAKGHHVDKSFGSQALGVGLIWGLL